MDVQMPESYQHAGPRKVIGNCSGLSLCIIDVESRPRLSIASVIAWDKFMEEEIDSPIRLPAVANSRPVDAGSAILNLGWQ
jgi:hypothetical protein